MPHKGTVLIVDDEPESVQLLKRVLSGGNYQLFFATTGSEALSQAKATNPDVILLDVMLPNVNGFEICRRLRADPVLAEVPIIMITALDASDARLQGFQAGADEFISKPFSIEELQARVSTTVRLNRYRRLLAERAKFKWVIEQSQEGYIILDNYGLIKYANTQARLFLGIPAAQPEGSLPTFLELVQNYYNLEPQDAWANWPQKSEQKRYLILPESATSNARWLAVDLLSTPQAQLEGESELVVRLDDATQQMGLSNDMRSFHGMLRHKLITPVSQILNSAELLRREATALAIPKMTTYSEITVNGARRLTNEIRDIFTYLQAPYQATGKNNFKLSELSKLVDPMTHNWNVTSEFRFEVPGAENLQILMSPRAVELIFWEILENAVKFHPNQSPVINIVVSKMDSRAAVIRIYDNGLTLTPNQLAQAWTPYFQGEKYFTGEMPGMGLGLPTVFLVVNSVGGACAIYNRNDGPGIVIELTIPLAESRQTLQNQQTRQFQFWTQNLE